MPIARWSLLARTPSLPRSSHCLSVTPTGRVILYGGELKPRTPVDIDNPGAVHTFDAAAAILKADSHAIAWKTLTAPSELAPEPRVGATTAVLGDHLYLWGGRGGTEMAPMPPEQAGVWRFRLSDKDQNDWERLAAQNEVDAPQPRSYHTMTSSTDKLYIHAGCPASGRLSELHSFDVASRSWKALSPAPDPGRGGTVLTFVNLKKRNVLLRFAGFAGYELGADHALDIYDIELDTWCTVVPDADAVHGFPGPRSVHGFVGFTSAKHPAAVALLYHGERDASTLGHAGAGTFWSDVWILEETESGLTWKFIPVAPEGPEGRGWFPSASYARPDGSTRVVMQGGLLTSNQRSDELWALDIDE